MRPRIAEWLTLAFTVAGVGSLLTLILLRLGELR